MNEEGKVGGGFNMEHPDFNVCDKARLSELQKSANERCTEAWKPLVPWIRLLKACCLVCACTLFISLKFFDHHNNTPILILLIELVVTATYGAWVGRWHQKLFEKAKEEFFSSPEGAEYNRLHAKREEFERWEHEEEKKKKYTGGLR